MSTCRRNFDETKYISFLIEDDELLEKFNEIQVQFQNSNKKVFDSEPVSNEKNLKAKIKSYTDFHNNEIQISSIQISTIMKYQKKVLRLFSYQ